MDLSKRIGITFVVFTSFALAMNLLYRGNPDFILNVSMESVLLIMFTISIIAPDRMAGVIQISCMIVSGALAPMSPGGPIFSSVIVVLALVLVYAYGGFQTMAIPKTIVSFLGMYLVILFNLTKMEEYGMSIFIRAFGWTVFMGIVCFILWLVVEEIHRRFHLTREREWLRINSELIKLNHELLDGGCLDATREPTIVR